MTFRMFGRSRNAIPQGLLSASCLGHTAMFAEVLTIRGWAFVRPARMSHTCKNPLVGKNPKHSTNPRISADTLLFVPMTASLGAKTND